MSNRCCLKLQRADVLVQHPASTSPGAGRIVVCPSQCSISVNTRATMRRLRRGAAGEKTGGDE